MKTLTYIQDFFTFAYVHGEMNILFILFGICLAISLFFLIGMYTRDWYILYHERERIKNEIKRSYSFRKDIFYLMSTWKKYRNISIYFLVIAVIILIFRIFHPITPENSHWAIGFSLFTLPVAFAISTLLGRRYIAKKYPDVFDYN